MTSPSRMKRQTTRRARTTWARTAASVLASCLFVGGSPCRAQDLPPPPFPPAPAEASIATEPPRPLDLGAPATPADSVTPAIFVGKAGEGIQQTRQESLPDRFRDRPEDTYDFSVTTELPGPERLFRRQSEKEFFERVREDYIGRAGTGRVPG